MVRGAGCGVWGAGLRIPEMPKEAHHKAAKDITTCLENKVLKHQIARKFSFNEVAAAHEAVENSQGIGNVVIDIN